MLAPQVWLNLSLYNFCLNLHKKFTQLRPSTLTDLMYVMYLPPQYFNPEEFKFDDPPAPKDPDYDIEYDF